jgi:hypothetical protein
MTSIGVDCTSIRGGGLGLKDFVKGPGEIAVGSLFFKLSWTRRWLSKAFKKGFDPRFGFVSEASDEVADLLYSGHRK